MDLKDKLGLVLAALALWVAYYQISEANRYLNASNTYAVESELTEAAFDLLSALSSTTANEAEIERKFLILDFRFAHALSLAQEAALVEGSWNTVLGRLCTMFGPRFGGVLRDGTYRLKTMREECQKYLSGH